MPLVRKIMFESAASRETAGEKDEFHAFSLVFLRLFVVFPSEFSTFYKS